MPKKNFTKADGAIDRMFSKTTQHANITNVTNDTNNTNIEHVTKHTDDTKDLNVTKHTKHENDTNNTNNTKHTHVLNVTKQTNVTNKSKHYDKRGPRKERLGLLMDTQLKSDLTQLANATGSRSVNDLIITLLLEHIEQPEIQARLGRYKELI